MLSKHATTWYEDGYEGGVVYHQTPIVKWNAETITLNTGGHWSNTTKKKMNQSADKFGLGFSVYQKNFDWFVEMNGETIPFDEKKMVLER